MAEKYCNIFFHLICILGCSYQIQNILASYFKFASVTKMRFSHPDSIDYYPLHYCFLCLENILDIPAIAKKYHLKESDLATDGDKFELYNTITIADMLEYTSNDAFAGCSYRSEDGNVPVFANLTLCKSFYSVRKYIAQQYVCYEVKAKVSKSFKFRQIGTTLNFERMIHGVNFPRGKLASSQKIRPMISKWRYPVMEMPYTTSYYKESKDNIRIQVSCNNISTKWLGYPYDDFICQSKDDPVDYFQCRDSCIEKHSLETLDRLPYTSFYDSSYPLLDRRLISETLLKNVTISKMVNSWFEKCHRSCPMFSCEHSYCLTTGHANQYSYGAQGSTIRVEIASAPTNHMEIVPQVPFLDFIIYVLSSLGTWFGLVIISCNPIKGIKLYQEYKQKKQVQAQIVDNRRQDQRDLILRRIIPRSRYYEQYFNSHRLSSNVQ